MSVREVLRMGDPRLRLKASVVDWFGDDKLANLINDMLDTMKAFDGAGSIRKRQTIAGCARHLRIRYR